MRIFKNPLLAVFIFLTFFSISWVQAQKMDKYLVKSSAFYDEGEYAKSLKQIEKLKKKAKKKYGSENKFLAIGLVTQAKIDVARGVLQDVGTQIEQAVTMSQNVNGDSTLDHAYILLESAEVWTIYGNFLKASQYLDQVNTIYTKNAVEETSLVSRYQVLMARMWEGKGFYRNALSLINEQLPIYTSKALSSSKKDAPIAKKSLAQLMILKANTYRKMGNYTSADSAFNYNDAWIKKNLSKTDITYSANLALQAQLLEENGLQNTDLLEKMYMEAYTIADNKYAKGHLINIEIRKNLIRILNKQGNNRAENKLKVISKEFEQIVEKNYPKTSIHRLTLKTVNYDMGLDNSRIKNLESQVNSLLASEAIIPSAHSKRIDLLEFANKVAIITNRRYNTESYLTEILRIKKELYGEDSPNYHLTLTKLAGYYVNFSDRFAEAKNIYENSYLKIVEPEISEKHIDYLEIMGDLAVFYEESDLYTKASQTLDKALLAAQTKYDNKDIEYANQLQKIALLQIKIGEYDKSQKNIDQALVILEETKNDQSKIYQSQTYVTQAKLLAIKGEYDEAENSIFKSEKIIRKLDANVASTVVSADDDLASLYISLGRFSKAQDIIEMSLKEKSRIFGVSSRHLAEPMTLKANLKYTIGEYTEAEDLAKKSLNITQTVFGEQSTKNAQALLVLSKLYRTIGDFDKSIDYNQQALKVQTDRFGNNHVDVAKTTSELALAKFFRGDNTSDIEALFIQSEKVIGKKLGSQSPAYAEVLKNLAIINIAAANYSISITYLDDALKIWSAKIGRRNNINAATVNILKGDIYYAQKLYERSLDFYTDAKKLYEKLFDDSHPEYVRVLSKLSKTYYMMGNKTEAQDAIELVLGNYSGFIEEFFPALSEREKAKFWNTIKEDYEYYNTLVVSQNKLELVGSLYNNALLTKALLLSSSIKVRERIMSSGDEELKTLFDEWINKKELLTTALSMSSTQLQENDIDPNTINNEIEDVEKQLSLKSESFKTSFEAKPIKWEDIRSILKPNEVAVEMIRYRHFSHQLTDSVLYAILYIKGGEKKARPDIIVLDNGKDMETKYLKFYRNSIKFKLSDNKSYDQFWAPIVNKIGTSSTVYLSPDGVYNQINIESLALADGSYVLDNSNIVLVSNTKDLYTHRVQPKVNQQQNVAFIVGNPKFYVDTQPGIPKEGSGLTRETTEKVSQLPGTQEEVNQLKQLLRTNGWKAREITDEFAAETEVKKVDNPKIFHIATHGFFQTGQKLTASASGEAYSEAKAYENPLLRSGLLLAGAGDILNETRFNYNIDNGILTAYEAMNLNLDQTDLVVLSACETGLGEVQAGEGVYGLQRAFLVAGAKSVVMSLFKVSDDATQKLMVKFYEKWLTSGNKRQAFIDAKKEIRNEYGDPIYWGPFVMIGVE